MPNEFIIRNGLVVQSGTTTITGSLIISGSLTGSFTGNVPTASYAVTASYALSGGSGGGTNTVRHEYSEPYDYLGVAPSGTLESSPTWDITRLTIYLDGTALNQTASGAWTDRASLIYT
jgi:hypothetical protein